MWAKKDKYIIILFQKGLLFPLFSYVNFSSLFRVYMFKTK